MASNIILTRLADFIYWAFFIFSLLIMVISFNFAFDEEKSGTATLIFSFATYMLGFGLRYLITGHVNHPVFISILKTFRRN